MDKPTGEDIERAFERIENDCPISARTLSAAYRAQEREIEALRKHRESSDTIIDRLSEQRDIVIAQLADRDAIIKKMRAFLVGHGDCGCKFSECGIEKALALAPGKEKP